MKAPTPQRREKVGLVWNRKVFGGYRISRGRNLSPGQGLSLSGPESGSLQCGKHHTCARFGWRQWDLSCCRDFVCRRLPPVFCDRCSLPWLVCHSCCRDFVAFDWIKLVVVDVYDHKLFVIRVVAITFASAFFPCSIPTGSCSSEFISFLTFVF